MMQNISLSPDWLKTPATQAFIALCEQKKLPIRFVGGCVRDAVMGVEHHASQDIDVATTALPNAVIAACANTPYNALPTGIAHGTVTVMVFGIAFEVTTLRIDTRCDGRHAEVHFTDDWEQDAQRRDFTCNALMLSPEGVLYDYTGGVEDARNGCIRFIGDAATRITEDALRIVRFFRFYATHGRVELDEVALGACRDAAHTLTALSAERIAREMQKLLTSHNPYAALNVMQRYDILRVLCPDISPQLSALSRLIEAEQQAEQKPNPWTRLVVLTPSHAAMLGKQWKLSTRVQRYLSTLTQIPVITSDYDVRCTLYRYGRELVMGGLLRDVAKGDVAQSNVELNKSDADNAAIVILSEAKDLSLLDKILRFAQNDKNVAKDGVFPPNYKWIKMAEQWESPVFPLSGEILMRHGMSSGRAMGDALKRLEAAWIASDFQLTETELLTMLSNTDIQDEGKDS